MRKKRKHCTTPHQYLLSSLVVVTSAAAKQVAVILEIQAKTKQKKDVIIRIVQNNLQKNI